SPPTEVAPRRDLDDPPRPVCGPLAAVPPGSRITRAIHDSRFIPVANPRIGGDHGPLPGMIRPKRLASWAPPSPRQGMESLEMLAGLIHSENPRSWLVSLCRAIGLSRKDEEWHAVLEGIKNTDFDAGRGFDYAFGTNREAKVWAAVDESDPGATWVRMD